MKFLFGLMVALAFTIAWQTSVLSGQENGREQQSVTQVQLESTAAGRVPPEDDGCD